MCWVAHNNVFDTYWCQGFAKCVSSLWSRCWDPWTVSGYMENEKKHAINTKQKIYQQQETNKQNNTTTNKKHLLCIHTAFFLIPLVDLGNRKETISLQQLILDQSFICCWLVMWSIMINHMQDYLKIIPVYKWQHPTEAV